MAWTESYHCDVCNAPRNDAGDWWLAWTEETTPARGEARQPMLRMTRWTPVLSQSMEVKHLCGARCAQTMIDRWMGLALQAEAGLAVQAEAGLAVRAEAGLAVRAEAPAVPSLIES